MRAVRYHSFGQVMIEDVPIPSPGEGQALVRVRAAALNPVDAKILAGQFAGASPPRTLGLDFAGELPDGKRVFGSGQFFGVRFDGAFAEYVAAPVASLAPVPEGVSFEQAAALGVVFLTAQLAVEAARLSPGEAAAVYGAGGGVGSAFLQLARSSGARLIAVTSDEARALRMGAAEVVDRRRENVFARLAALGPLHAVVDTLGGSWFERSLPLLAPYGRLLSIGVTGGERARVELDLPAFYRRGAQIIGINSTLLGPDERGERLRRVAEAFQRGGLLAPEVEVLPLARAPEALARVGRYETGGRKLVLLPTE